MGVVVPVGFAQVSLVFQLSGDAEDMVVTMGVDAGAETDPTVIADTVTINWEAAGTAWASTEMADEYTLGPSVCTIMTPTGPQIGTGTSVIPGSSSGVLPPPNNTAVLIQKRTDRGGREGRGRMYVPPAVLNEANVGSTGDLVPAQLTAWQTSATTFLLAMDSSGFPLVLLHSEAAGPLTPDPITALTVQQKVATQRTRMRR